MIDGEILRSVVIPAINVVILSRLLARSQDTLRGDATNNTA